MNTLMRRILVLCPLVVGLLAFCPAMDLAAATDDSHPVQKWLSIGQPGPKAIELTVWAERPDGKEVKTGDPVVVHLKAARKAYVTALYVSPTGDTTVLFPNKSNPNNLVEPEKQYTLFKPETDVNLVLSDQTKDARIVFFASDKPLDLAPLKMAEGDNWLSVPMTAKQEMEVLVKKIEAFTKDEGFNKQVLALKSGGKKGLGLMGLPVNVKSSRPEGIAGVQGAKTKVGDSGKE
ncbi:MAG: DUF4384 domain-containing protein [Deltaproteobacteria bacterium]|nr:DUF4384 domain-containing protein [Deltaproteobacteria bacterium]